MRAIAFLQKLLAASTEADLAVASVLHNFTEGCDTTDECCPFAGFCSIAGVGFMAYAAPFEGCLVSYYSFSCYWLRMVSICIAIKNGVSLVPRCGRRSGTICWHTNDAMSISNFSSIFKKPIQVLRSCKHRIFLVDFVTTGGD